MKLFPLLGIGISFLICHSYLLERYQQLERDIANKDFKDLDIMHHLTSGTKSLYSQICFDGLMVIRQSIGGAGYSAWSGLPYLIDDFSATPTFEGDNTVMAQ
jgi:acyl-CoA oxidase